jgi:hypothetical protein
MREVLLPRGGLDGGLKADTLPQGQQQLFDLAITYSCACLQTWMHGEYCPFLTSHTMNASYTNLCLVTAVYAKSVATTLLSIFCIISFELVTCQVPKLRIPSVSQPERFYPPFIFHCSFLILTLHSPTGRIACYNQRSINIKASMKVWYLPIPKAARCRNNC